MSAYSFIAPLVGQPGVSATGTWGTAAGQAPPLPFGFVGGALDTSLGYAEFMFVKGPSASAPAAGDACLIKGDFAAQQLVSGNTASQGPVGIVPAAVSATNVYGWAQIAGLCDYAKMGTATANPGAPVVIGSTAGRLQATAGATGYVLNGAKVSAYTASSAQSNAATLQLYYPMYDGRNQ